MGREVSKKTAAKSDILLLISVAVWALMTIQSNNRVDIRPIVHSSTDFTLRNPQVNRFMAQLLLLGIWLRVKESFKLLPTLVTPVVAIETHDVACRRTQEDHQVSVSLNHFDDQDGG